MIWTLLALGIVGFTVTLFTLQRVRHWQFMVGGYIVFLIAFSILFAVYDLGRFMWLYALLQVIALAVVISLNKHQRTSSNA